jgi:hypothetical protein
VARTVPVVANEVPGNFITSALWTAQVSATMNFLMGSGSNGVPRFKGWQSSAQSIATGATDTPITLDTEDYDSDNGHSTVTNSSRYTVQVAGTYRVIAVGGFTTNSVGNRKLGINVNGTNARGASIQQPALASNSWVGAVSTELALSVGDYIEMVMWHTSTTTPLTTAIGVGFGPAMSVCWISS